MADLPSARPLTGVGPTFPPKQWIALGVEWEKQGQDIKARNFDAPPAQIKLTPDDLTKMQAIMRGLPMRLYQYVPGSPWKADPMAKAADCNGLALGRRAALIDAGYDPGALRPAIVQNNHGEWHMVLTIDTDHGTFVVDGMEPMLQAWDRAPFKWNSRLVQGLKWERFEP